MALFRDAQVASKLSLVHTLDYYDKDNVIISDYPVLRPTGTYSFKQGQLYQLFGNP